MATVKTSELVAGMHVCRTETRAVGARRKAVTRLVDLVVSGTEYIGAGAYEVLDTDGYSVGVYVGSTEWELKGRGQ